LADKISKLVKEQKYGATDVRWWFRFIGHLYT